MNVQQLRIMRETVRQGFNLSQAATVLNASQSGLSKHIQELEYELGVTLFVRRGKRLIGLTSEGAQLLPVIERLNHDLDNLKQQAADLRHDQSGVLAVATTHTQARYVLPPVVSAFRAEFPQVQLKLHQASPDDIAHMLCQGQADIGIATESLTHFDALRCEPFYQWQHCLIMPAAHPLASQPVDSLQQLADWPLITYHDGFTGRQQIDQRFAESNITPEIVLTALDADVIKTYVRTGLGVGIIANMAYTPEEALTAQPVDFFGVHTTWIAQHAQSTLRQFGLRFIALCHQYHGIKSGSAQ